jgi:hypothetical protein
MPSSNISSEVAWAAMMLWRAAALMATTFCMTGSHSVAAWRRFVGLIGSERTFRDVCAKSGKWFHAQENCFVAGSATKQSGMKSPQFE